MARITLARGKASVTKRNAKHYLNRAVPYLSLLLSIIAILKAYNVLL
jgi:hypothetical protein